MSRLPGSELDVNIGCIDGGEIFCSAYPALAFGDGAGYKHYTFTVDSGAASGSIDGVPLPAVLISSDKGAVGVFCNAVSSNVSEVMVNEVTVRPRTNALLTFDDETRQHSSSDDQTSDSPHVMNGLTSALTPQSTQVTNPSINAPSPYIIVDDLDLGVIHLNSNVTVTMNLTFEGSLFSVENITFPEPFHSWYIPNTSSADEIYPINNGSEDSKSIDLLFNIKEENPGNYSGSFNVYAADSSGLTYTATAKVNATIADNEPSSYVLDFLELFLTNPFFGLCLLFLAQQLFLRC